jgi:hypothetical protein
MKRNFTRILAAFALLVFTMPSLVAWGQTKDEVVAYTLQPATGSNNNYASNCDITIDGITWNLTGNSTMIPWRIGGKSLSGVDRALYSKTAISDNISKIEVTHGAASSITVNSWTVIVASDADFTNVVSTLTPTFAANATTTINRPDGTDWSNCYYKFVYNVTVSGSSNKFLEFSQAKFYKETGTTLQDSDLSLSPTALTFDLFDDAEAKTITISTSSTGAISVSNNTYISTVVNGVATITVTPVAVTPEAQTITVSQAADNTYNAGEATFTVSVANSTPTYTVTYKANGGTGDDVVDTYYQGEDVTVRSNTFVYTGHAFTKWNTAANGSGTDYQPAATIENIQANVELFAQWEESNEVVDVLTNSNTIGETTNNYSDWTATGTSGAEYSGNSAGGNGTIQLRSNNSNSGIVSTVSGGLVKKVVVTWHSATSNGRTLNVYGNNTAYSVASDLYGDNAGTLLGTIVMGSSTELNISGDYEYIGLRSASGAMYLEDIHITWEPDNNPVVATTVTINVPEDFNTDIYQGTTAGTLTATVTAGGEAISNATVTWSSSDETVATIDANGAVTLVAVGTTTITANYAGVEGQYRPSTDTYELSVIDSNAPGTETNPYTVAQAIAAIDDANGETVNGKYATGFVSNIETAYSTQYHNITFDIVDETGNEVFLRAYRCGGDEAADVQVGDSVVVYGNLYYYETGSLYEFAQGCQLISLVHPVSTVPSITFDPDVVNLDAAQHLTLQVPFTYENLEIENYESFAVQFYDTNNEPTTKPNWIFSASVTGTNDEGYNVTLTVISANEGEARSCYFKVYVGETYSNLVTVNQAAYVAPATGNNYALYSGDLVEGDYLIVYNGKAMNNVVVNDRLQYVGVTTNNDVIVMENAEAIWHIAPSGEYWTIYSADANAYAASTGVKNKAQMLVDGTDNKALWTVSGTETYEFVNKHNAANNVNSNLRNNGEYGFACYATSTGGALSLYKRNNDYTPAIAIEGYGEGEGGYVLVASPVSTTPVAAGMITDEATDPEEFTFDLYKFDQNANDGLEWRNYRATSFDLVPGEGYLYANKNNVTLSFAGTAYTGDGQVPVVAGYNLVGNPYAVAANLSVPYYRLNASGSELSASTESSAVNAMEGVFVQATEAGSVTFTTSNSGNGKSNAVVMNLSRNRGTVIDNAIVRFDNGRQLPKFQLFENSTKLYIPQGNKDYAIVRSAAQGEMPVSFRASENGTYTIAVEAENVEMNYLHLIDNMTGADVDLLATPNYTFEARTNDYTSRFRLVFSANGIDEQNAETFAFFNGTSWTVSNTGDATLQVVDITGRIISSETINGNATVSLNQPAGIYMLRLVNGNDVKVQKVVVR